MMKLLVVSVCQPKTGMKLHVCQEAHLFVRVGVWMCVCWEKQDVNVNTGGSRVHLHPATLADLCF